VSHGRWRAVRQHLQTRQFAFDLEQPPAGRAHLLRPSRQLCVAHQPPPRAFQTPLGCSHVAFGGDLRFGARPNAMRLALDRRPLVRETLQRRMRAGDQRVRFMGVAQQLAARLKVGSAARYLARENEPLRERLRLQRGLPRLTLNALHPLGQQPQRGLSLNRRRRSVAGSD
jgi:hypothetical protein